MSRLTKIVLTDAERAALEKGYKFGKVHGFRQRCQMILLKAKQKPSREIADQLGCCMVSVNGWVKRYQSEGIDGLHIKEGRGRPAILQYEWLQACDYKEKPLLCLRVWQALAAVGSDFEIAFKPFAQTVD